MAEEARLEAYLKRQVTKHGGLTLKFTSPSVRGVPDQLVIFGKSGPVFIELKASNGRLHPLQKAMHAKLERHGATVYVVSSRQAIDELLLKIGA